MPADLDQLLEGSSRTFALTIPLLPEPTRREVTVAYLLFRLADTLEDGEAWSRDRRTRGLRALEGLLVQAQAEAQEAAAQAALATPGAPAEQVLDEALNEAPGEADEPLDGAVARFADELRRDPPTAHAGYLALNHAAPEVFRALRALAPRAREVVLRHLLVTTRGMAEGLEQEGGTAGAAGGDGLRLRSLGQLRRYCYLVAGVVGEMLTELFLLDAPIDPAGESALAAAAATLRTHARAFGEGLQLTNILKDQGDDAREQRHFVPEAVERRSLFALARQDLADAARYVGALLAARAPEGLVAFTALPVRLALDTLAAVEARGAGAKVSREQLALAMDEVSGMLRGERRLEAVLRTG